MCLPQLLSYLEEEATGEHSRLIVKPESNESMASLSMWVISGMSQLICYACHLLLFLLHLFFEFKPLTMLGTYILTSKALSSRVVEVASRVKVLTYCLCHRHKSVPSPPSNRRVGRVGRIPFFPKIRKTKGVVTAFNVTSLRNMCKKQQKRRQTR